MLVSALRNGRSDVRQRDKTPRCVAGCRLPSTHSERLNQRAHESNKRTTQQKAIGSVCVYVLVVLHARAADVSIAHEQDVESLKVVERLSSFGLRTNKQTNKQQHTNTYAVACKCDGCQVKESLS